MPKYGSYSHDIVLARPDRRTREGRLLRQMREALFAHLGGEAKLSPTKRALVERAAMLQLRCAKLDERIVSGEFTELDSRTYLAFSNSLRRTLVSLGLDAAPERPMTAAEALTAIHARAGKAAA